ncbi:hypothetical protein CVT26_009823 [Gymnopilus dilepis]|uniref:PHD-type domain-containing protein n=1 Tax=Gymnopilus dilepis TaxID=231916 RepID=A0A409VKW3_9AGAR|nr:hypothetical protein CVT26_009823 [Gymnopilus dilepis]
MSPRKRRQEQAFPEEEGDAPPTLDGEDDGDKRRAEKEQEAWDAIREAHYEGWTTRIACTASLLPALQKYIKKRRTMAGIEDDSRPGMLQQPPRSPERCDMPLNSHSNRPGLQTPGTTRASSSESVGDQHTRTGLQSTSPPTSDKARELLSHVAFMAEELLRASQEKVNLAQANHEMVERHIRLLDQAIKEQEAGLSKDHSQPRSGDLLAPKYRQSQTTLKNGLDAHEGNVPMSEFPDDYLMTSQSTARRKKGFLRGIEKDSTGTADQGRKTTLTITLPATQQNEELYCYCNRVSFGAMIACDSQSCEREWFHLGCVGLTEVPEGEWYCEDCRVDEL